MLSSLTELNLSLNNIGAEGTKELTPYLGNLSSLTSLNLSANNIGAEGMKKLAPHWGKLSSLTSLYLGSNDIGAEGMKELAPHLGKLSYLTSLGLSANNIGAEGMKKLAPQLGMLSSLTTLNLNSNNLRSNGCDILFQSLTTLSSVPLSISLQDNNISILPDSLFTAHRITNLGLKSNPLVEPSSRFIEKSSLQEIKSLLRLQKEQLSRVRLLFVGFGNVGKTCSWRALHNSNLSADQLKELDNNNKSTHGIDTHVWTPLVSSAASSPPPVSTQSLTFNVWEFGGQMEYYIHHRHFLARHQAVYVVVFPATVNDILATKQVGYWLHFIKYQIGDIFKRAYAARSEEHT